jgi:hypothetical protein
VGPQGPLDSDPGVAPPRPRRRHVGWPAFRRRRPVFAAERLGPRRKTATGHRLGRGRARSDECTTARRLGEVATPETRRSGNGERRSGAGVRVKMASVLWDSVSSAGGLIRTSPRSRVERSERLASGVAGTAPATRGGGGAVRSTVETAMQRAITRN